MNPLIDDQSTEEDVYTFQVHRLKSMKAYPKDDRELIRIAKSHTGSVLDLASCISAFVEYAPECPAPCDFRAALDALKPAPPDKIEQWKKEGLKHDPDFAASLLANMSGKNSPDEYARHRWGCIKDALDGQGLFWAEYLNWAIKNHPQEVAAIRAGRTPELPHPEAYKLHWADLPKERARSIAPHVPSEEIDRLKQKQNANRTESEPQ
jgi:hypothetical protein